MTQRPCIRWPLYVILVVESCCCATGNGPQVLHDEGPKLHLVPCATANGYTRAPLKALMTRRSAACHTVLVKVSCRCAIGLDRITMDWPNPRTAEQHDWMT